jgi:hypothetical protein
MNTTTTIEELADALFDTHQASDLDNGDFCQCLISCAVSIATRDGIEDKEIFDLIIRAATGALVTVRAREEFARRGLDTTLEVH